MLTLATSLRALLRIWSTPMFSASTIASLQRSCFRIWARQSLAVRRERLESLAPGSSACWAYSFGAVGEGFVAAGGVSFSAGAEGWADDWPEGPSFGGSAARLFLAEGAWLDSPSCLLADFLLQTWGTSPSSWVLCRSKTFVEAMSAERDKHADSKVKIDDKLWHIRKKIKKITKTNTRAITTCRYTIDSTSHTLTLWHEEVWP